MIKVLDKAFGILEEIVVASPQAVALAPLAAKLRINKATCSRIIKELTEAGYLEQVSRQAGYIAGPRALTLGLRVSYAAGLLAAADAPIRNCAEKLGQSVLLAILHRGQRYILIHHNFNPAMKIDLPQLAFNDAFATATGLVLLAYADEQEREAARALCDPMTCDLFRIARGKLTEEQLWRKIRDQKFFASDIREHPWAIVASPVFRQGEFAAALGMSAPHAEFKEKAMSAAVAAAAEEISANLSGSSQLG